MKLCERMDPELWVAYKDLPRLPRILANVVESRKIIAEMLRKERPAPDTLARIAVSNTTIPETKRGPAVPVRIYSPSVRPMILPGLVWIHGGGFTLGNVEHDDALCRRLAQAVGSVVLSVEYRLAPESPFPAAAEDCYAALTWLAKSAAQLGVDPTRIAVGGQSAGGGLAAGVAIMARDRGEISLACQLLLSPCLDDRHITQSSYEVTDERTWNRAQSLEGWPAYLGRPSDAVISPYAAPARLREFAGLAASYLMVGELDLVRDEVIDYATRLIQSGVATELHVWPGAFHGFEFIVPNARISQQAVRDYTDALIRRFHQ